MKGYDLAVLTSNVRDCQCHKCVGACNHTPGWFLPGEAEQAATLMGTPFDDFKKNLILDSCEEGFDDAPYVYSPRKVNVDRAVQTHRSQNSKETHGACVFLKDSKCSIHAAKPHECRVVLACGKYPRSLRDNIESKWIAAGAPLGMRP